MKNIVFDLDDTLWDLNKKACKLTGVYYHKLRTFLTTENPYLTDKEKVDLLNIYQNPILWENIEWINGAKAISSFEMLADDVKVYIISNCMNQAIADKKRSFLSKELDIPDSQIILNVEKCATEKKMIDDIYILVDDSPYNIAQSKAKYTIIPNKPWNQEVENPNTDLFRLNNLNNILDFIRLLILGKTKD